MCHADLAGHGIRAAAHQCHVADGVVWGAERPCGHEGGIAGQNARHRVDFGRFERLVQGEGREDGGQAAREHGFAGAGRTDQDHVVAAGRGEFEGAFDVFLAAHVAEIHVVVVEIGGKFLAGIDV